MSLPWIGHVRIRWMVTAAAGLVAVVVAALLVFAHGGPARHAAAPRGLSSVPAVPYTPGGTELARLRSDAPEHAAPGAPARGVAPATWYGRPSVLPVIGTRPGWVQVRLAQRPNGSTTWLEDRYVTVGSTPYRIVVDLTTTHLELYRLNQLVLTSPAGVGAPDDPTPTGSFFVAFHQPPPDPNPGYGPFILVTSAHSRAIDDWAGSGDAVIGIHGPLGEAARIGTTGARISHGCVRLPTATLTRLANIPAGTPVTITTS